ncbi:MAG: DUF2062 domain-containing protein [Planctomycetes bacterium]|jgi:uncharacterized protein (DUF2062 family)|nr:DUF2062 domain-containing protein [Phycisphaerae bacterium]NBB96007.1 DUF2062 domain-containing protein [Planctomycetota bacterium]
MPVMTAAKILIGRLERFFIYRVLSLDDTPHRIALGVAIGIFVTWTPSIPLQMVSVVALSCLLRANKFVGVPFVWISNPLTIVPIYGPNLLVGRWILGRPLGDVDALYAAMHFSGGIVEGTQLWWTAMHPILLDLWVGSLIVATILGVLTYFAMYRAVILWRRRWHLKHPAYRRAMADSDSQAGDESTDDDPPSDNAAADEAAGARCEKTART